MVLWVLIDLIINTPFVASHQHHPDLPHVFASVVVLIQCFSVCLFLSLLSCGTVLGLSFLLKLLSSS